MQKFELFDTHYWKPLKFFGLTHSFWNLNSNTIVNTWLVLIIIFILSIIFRFQIKKKDTIFGFLILKFVRSFNNLIMQTTGFFSYNYFYFITSIFIFIFSCNIISLIPGLEEPTTDVSTTLALGIISFLYVQYQSIKVHGIIEYIKEYFSPFFLLFPLNVIGELAKIVSISFRLFGNIFGGAIISKLWLNFISQSFITEIIGIILGMNIIIVLFFILFEGFIQAFVFTMLTLTYLSIAISNKNSEETTGVH